jgi:hypothetical protein
VRALPGARQGLSHGQVPPGSVVDSQRAEGARAYLNAKVLAVLEASARTPAQLAELLLLATLQLKPDELARLTALSSGSEAAAA